MYVNRAEEALNRRRARAVQRAQRKLWLERNRLLKNVQVLASTWRKNTKRAKSETPARQRFNFSQFSKESLSTPQDSLSMPRTARSDITAPAFGSKQLPQLPVVATTVPNTPRHPDVLPLPQCSGIGLTTTKSCMIRPFSTHSIASEHAENASLSTRTVLQEQQATTALSPTLGNLPLSSDDAIVSAGSQPLAADNDLCMRMLTPPLVEAVASQASGTTISESNSQPGLRRSLVSTRLPTLSVRELKKPVSGLKQRALAPLRDRVVLSKLRKSRMSMMEPSTTPALDVAATMDEDTISTTSNVPVIPAFQRQRSLSESDMLKVQDRPGPVVATEADQQTVSTVASTVVAPAPISARRMQTLRTRSLKVKTNSTNSIQIKLSAATPGPTRKTIVLSRLTRMRTRIANSKLAAAVLAVIAVLAMLCRPVCRICRKVLDTTWFDKVIIGCIIVNAGCISSYYYGLSKNHETFLQISEFFFAWVFTLGM